MKNFIICLFFLSISSLSFADWTDISPNIDDDFTDVAFNFSVGVVSGKKGAYYSLSGGIDPSSWIPINQFNDSADSILYKHTQFYACESSSFYHRIFLCGKDTVNNTAVLFVFNTSTYVLQSFYIGSIGSKLNDLGKTINGSQIYGVGDNGLIITIQDNNNWYPTSPVQIAPTNFNYNLNSLSVSGFTIICVADDYRLIGSISTNNPTAITFIQYYSPGSRFKGGIQFNSYNYAFVGKSYYRQPNGLPYSEYHYYYADSLQGNVIQSVSGGIYVGTDNGVYKVYSNDILEFQPSSQGKAIFGFANDASNGSRVFAVGSNATIIYTNDSGGTPQPYATITTDGGCISTGINITSKKGTVNNCHWYIDNVNVNNSCNNFSYTFTSNGPHSVRLIFSNSSYTDTIERTITIVNPPQINMNVSLLDSFLCKLEPVTIQLDNSEENVYYTLYQYGANNTTLGTSSSGNSDTLSFTSQELNTSGNFYIRANSTLANCTKNFTDTIHIEVEHTKANFHINLVNAEINENVSFYQHCNQAQNFKWDFPSQAATSISFNSDETNLFNQLGQSGMVKLTAWSNHGCYDSIEKPGPYIYEISGPQDSCWAMVIKDPNEQSWQGYPQSNITYLASSSTGYFITGANDTVILSSKIANELVMQNKGCYMAKYTNEGVLKWIIKTDVPTGVSYQYHQTYFVKEASDESVYITGSKPQHAIVFIDNRGDSIYPYSGVGSFLIKLDKYGAFVWMRHSNYIITNIELDHNENEYITASKSVSGSYLANMTIYNENNVLLNTLDVSSRVCSDCNMYVVLGLDPNGNYLDHRFIEISNVNSVVLPLVRFDDQNNMYVCGSKETKGFIHEVNSSTVYNLPVSSGNYGGKLYLIKFNPSGGIEWVVNGKTNNTYNDVTEAFDLYTDHQGNTYLTGTNDGASANSLQVFENADGSTTTFDSGKYFFAKVNTNGICEWIQGNRNTYYGYGLQIVPDGNQLNVLAELITYNLSYETTDCILTSANGNEIHYVNGGSNYLIITYDQNGNILKAVASDTNNINEGSIVLSTTNGQLWKYRMVKAADNNYYISKNIGTFNTSNISGYSDFGFEYPDLDYDGIVHKIELDCGIPFYPTYTSTNDDLVCFGDNYTFPNGYQIQNIQNPIEYSYTIAGGPNTVDTIVNWTLSLFPSSSALYLDSVCLGSDYSFNDTLFTNIQTQMIYLYDTISSFGCHSKDTLIITPLFINDTVITQGNILTVTNYQNGLYQWINCDNNYQSLQGENTSYFEVSQNGNYAVIINWNQCIDTSECINVQFSELSEFSSSEYSFYPNPFTSIIRFVVPNQTMPLRVHLYNTNGQLLLSKDFTECQEYSIEPNIESGTYFLEIEGRETKTYKLIKL